MRKLAQRSFLLTRTTGVAFHADRSLCVHVHKQIHGPIGLVIVVVSDHGSWVDGRFKGLDAFYVNKRKVINAPEPEKGRVGGIIIKYNPATMISIAWSRCATWKAVDLPQKQYCMGIIDYDNLRISLIPNNLRSNVDDDYSPIGVTVYDLKEAVDSRTRLSGPN